MPHHSIPSDVTRYSVVREVAAGQMRLNAGLARSRSADKIARSDFEHGRVASMAPKG